MRNIRYRGSFINTYMRFMEYIYIFIHFMLVAEWV